MAISKQFLMWIKLNLPGLEKEEMFPYNLPIIKNTKEIEFHDKVTFFIGENGTGKSTILEAIAIKLGLNPEGGSKNFIFETKKTHSDLHENIILSKGAKTPKSSYFFRAETFYNLASNIEDLNIGSYYSDRESLHKLSHGEAYMSLIQNRFFKEGLYLLDEPESALSPTRQLTLLREIHELCENGSQFIIATHSPIIMAYPNSIIYCFDNGVIRNIEYEHTEHYAVTKHFIKDYKRMMNDLFQ